MSDLDQRLEEVRAAGRRLDAAVAQPLNRSGPIARNGEVSGGWLKTMFGGSGRGRAESSAERAAYLLKCQAVVAAHVIDRATTAAFPRSGGAAEYEVREVALPSDIGRALRNTAKADAQDLRTVYDHARPRTGLIANLVNFLR